jgi:hypothetical protein
MHTASLQVYFFSEDMLVRWMLLKLAVMMSSSPVADSSTAPQHIWTNKRHLRFGQHLLPSGIYLGTLRAFGRLLTGHLRLKYRVSKP